MTERETELIREVIASRPGVRSPAAVLRAEIRDGNGPALVDEVRRRTAAPVPGTAGAPPVTSLCDRCGEPGHVVADCPTLEPPATPASPAPPTTAVEPCLAGERCLRPSTPISSTTGYHARCGSAAAAWASLTGRGPAPAASGVNLAAEQVAESRAAREAAGRDQVAAVAS